MVTFQKVRNVLQLRNVVGTVTAVVNQQRKHVVELPTGMGREQVDQLVEYCPPKDRKQNIYIYIYIYI